jgi:vacuolar protein sorting-associated protein 53
MLISSRFVKRATQSTSKIDSLLKTLQVRPSPPEALVQAYLIHIGDRSEANFKKILELKGIRTRDQSSLTDLFNAHCNSSSNASLPANSPFLTSLQLNASSHTANSTSSSLKDATTGSSALSGGRFDPATLGSALMNAAREGVDRLGTPTIPLAGGIESLSSSPQPPEAGQANTTGSASNLNENLKNFGKFFRREGGAFGRFGRTNTTAEPSR